MAPIFVQCKDFFGTRIPISKNLIFREILISQISANNGETRKNIRIRIRGILLSSKGSGNENLIPGTYNGLCVPNHSLYKKD